MEFVEPIIVTGPLRSGVRLIAGVLDQRAELASGPELPVLHTIVRQACDIGATLGANLARHHALPPQSVHRLFRGVVADLVAARLAAKRVERFVLHSFAAALALEDYATVLPDARFVFLLRDPRAVAASLRRCSWRDPRTHAPFPYTVDPAAGARHWRDVMTVAGPQLARLTAAGRMTVVRYETLCREPQVTFARLARFLGIRTGTPCIPLESARRVTAAVENAHPPLRPGRVTPSSIEAWRTTLSEIEIRRIDDVTSELREAFDHLSLPGIPAVMPDDYAAAAPRTTPAAGPLPIATSVLQNL
jgi:hypothetical protein